MNLKDFFIENKEILMLLLFYMLLYSFNLDKFPVVTGDENWFINPAYDLVVFGKMGTTMIYGFYNIANFTYWQPPMYILLLATSFKLLGFGIVQARLVSVFLGFLTVIFTYQFGFKLYNKKIGLLSSLLLISNPVFFLISRTARMEIAVACFMVIALYCAVIALKNSKKNYYFASAFFATLALLSHPNGIIAIFAVSIIILVEKTDFSMLKFNLNFNEIFVFILGLILPLICYMWYISLDLTAFKGQFMANIGASPSNLLDNLIMEPTRYIELFWGLVNYDGILLTCVVFVIVAVLSILGLYYLVRDRKFSGKFLLIVLIINMGVLSFLVYHKYFIYLGLTLPYLSILITLTIKDKIKFQINKEGIISVIIVILWVTLIIGNFIFIATFLEKKKDYDYIAIEQEVHKYIPSGCVVVGDHNYWMALQNDYKYYGRERVYGSQKFQQNQIKTENMLADLNVDYILFDDLWAYDDDYIMNFVNQNCTLISEIPSNYTNGFGIVKVYKVKKSF